MSADAISDVTEALRSRLEDVLGENEVHVGPPIAADIVSQKLSLFLFQVEPNRDLRNAEYLVARPGDDQGPLVPARGIPLDLRFLISVFRKFPLAGQADHSELVSLGEAIRVIETNPSLRIASQLDQDVRLTLEPYSIEDMNRVWGLFPTASYQTSVVYLATPVFVSSERIGGARRVEDRQLAAGTRSAPSGGAGRQESGGPA